MKKILYFYSKVNSITNTKKREKFWVSNVSLFSSCSTKIYKAIVSHKNCKEFFGELKKCEAINFAGKSDAKKMYIL